MFYLFKQKNKKFFKSIHSPIRANWRMDRSSFTLIELLIVIGILAILTAAVVIILNPAELLKQSRDSKRMTDLASLDKAINLLYTQNESIFNTGIASTVYVSVPDNSSTTCGSLGLPALPSGYTYHCVPQASSTLINGTGWVPIDFTASGVQNISALPIDPVNTASTGLYYTYMTGGSYELTSLIESDKYISQSTNDGGMLPGVLQKGTHIDLTPPTRDKGLIAYWSFDEGTGTVSYDHSGNNKTATLYNSPTWINGKIGGALQLNGSTNYVKTNSSFSFVSPSNTLTFSYWINTNLIPQHQTLFGEATQPVNDGFVWIWRTNNDNNLHLQYANGSTQINVTAASFFSGYSGVWVQATIVADYNNKTVDIYRNGTLFYHYTTTNTMLFPSTARYKYLGAYSSSGDPFAGYMDDVRIYNRALSAVEILSIYNATK